MKLTNQMRILYVTPSGPDPKTGGGRHCYANLRALFDYPGVIIDYIGKEFDLGLEGIRSDKLGLVMARNFTRLDRLKAALHRSSSSLIGAFNEFKRCYSLNDYDLVFIETTRCGFVFDALNARTMSICCVHNVEVDYFKVHQRGLNRLATLYIKRSEQSSLRGSDIVLVMHHDDLDRLRAVYGSRSVLKYELHPVCSFTPRRSLLRFEEREKVIFFFGSLDILFNEISIIKFVKVCWPSLANSGYTLRIAGRNPSKRLSRFLTGWKNVELIANPDDMGTLLERAIIVILPDVAGAGMKLRVAEALSAGVPVVGTKRGLRGYADVEQFGLAVENIPDMTSAVARLLKDQSKLAELSLGAHRVWKRFYCYESFRDRLHGLLDQIILAHQNTEVKKVKNPLVKTLVTIRRDNENSENAFR